MSINANKLIVSFFGAVLVLTLSFASNIALSSSASATTINCAVTNPSGSNSNAGVKFDFSAMTCQDQSGTANVSDIDDFSINTSPGGNVFTLIGNGGGQNQTAHTKCEIGSFSAAAGVTCSDSRTTNGTETAVVSISLSNGDIATMTVGFTITNAGANYEINSGSVTITAATAATTTSSSSSPPSLQASLSRSQSMVISKNVGTRLSSEGPTGVSRGVEGQAGEDVQANFSSSYSNLLSAPQSTSRGSSVREILTLASFDTSQMTLSAASNEQNPMDTVTPREGTLSDRPFTAWGHGSYTSVDNERNDTGDDSRYSGDVRGYNVGVDYRYNDKLMAGVSLGYAETDLTTTYNSGSYDETSWSLTPYAMWKPIEGLSLSALGGYSLGDLDLKRDSNSITSSTETGMWFGALNAAYELSPSDESPLDISVKLGLLATNKTVEGYTESDGTVISQSTSNTRQVKPGLEAAYSFFTGGTTIQPFAKGDYVHDFKDPTNGDSGAYNVGGGVRFGSSSTGFSGLLEGSTQVGRDDYSEYTFSGMVAYGFNLGSESDSNASMATPYFKSNHTRYSHVVGTGVKYSHGTTSFIANLDITKTIPTTDTQENVAAMAKVGLTF